MRLGRHTNGISCEYKMQEDFNKWLKDKDIIYIDEFKVKEVGRIPDFLIINGGLINIEAKCNCTDILINQLKDNARYCNYSFAFIPDFSITPKWFKATLIKHGYGLIIYNYDTGAITEALEAHQNKDVDRKLMKIVRQRAEIELKKRASLSVEDTQKILFA